MRGTNKSNRIELVHLHLQLVMPYSPVPTISNIRCRTTLTPLYNSISEFHCPPALLQHSSPSLSNSIITNAPSPLPSAHMPHHFILFHRPANSLLFFQSPCPSCPSPPHLCLLGSFLSPLLSRCYTSPTSLLSSAPLLLPFCPFNTHPHHQFFHSTPHQPHSRPQIVNPNSLFL